MGRYSDYTGVPQTCPTIDDVLSFINSIEWGEDEKDLEKDAKIVVENMEKIRRMNIELREFGNAEAKRCEELQKGLDELKIENDALTSEIKYLENKLEESYQREL